MTPAPLALDAALLDAADALIAALDLIAGDPDLEAEPDCEPDEDRCTAAEDRLHSWPTDLLTDGDEAEASRHPPDWPDTWADHSPPRRRLDDERTT